jgi:hypothetical protein
MTREQEAFFGMALKVKNFNAKNTTGMTAVPAVAGFYTQLNTLIAALITADTGSRADLTGVAVSKTAKRQALETLALKLSNALASYSVITNDSVLQKRADFPTNRWYAFSEEELVTQTTIIKNLATPLASNLTPYGAVAADITAIGAALTAFTDVISDPSLAADQRKIDNVKVVAVIDQIRTLFTEKLDVLMRSFEVNSGSLYSLYQSARAIDINGAATAPTSITEILPNATATIHTSAVYEANTFYTLQNRGNEAVRFSLSTIENQEGLETVLLNPGETRSRLAENLAPMGIYLVVKNVGATPAQIKIWVE